MGPSRPVRCSPHAALLSAAAVVLLLLASVSSVSSLPADCLYAYPDPSNDLGCTLYTFPVVLLEPNSISYDSHADMLIIADATNSQVAVYFPNGSLFTMLQSDAAFPISLPVSSTVDVDGFVYLVNYNNSDILIFTAFPDYAFYNVIQLSGGPINDGITIFPSAEFLIVTNQSNLVLYDIHCSDAGTAAIVQVGSTPPLSTTKNEFAYGAAVNPVTGQFAGLQPDTQKLFLFSVHNSSGGVSVSTDHIYNVHNSSIGQLDDPRSMSITTGGDFIIMDGDPHYTYKAYELHFMIMMANGSSATGPTPIDTGVMRQGYYSFLAAQPNGAAIFIPDADNARVVVYQGLESSVQPVITRSNNSCASVADAGSSSSSSSAALPVPSSSSSSSAVPVTPSSSSSSSSAVLPSSSSSSSAVVPPVSSSSSSSSSSIIALPSSSSSSSAVVPPVPSSSSSSSAVSVPSSSSSSSSSAALPIPSSSSSSSSSSALPVPSSSSSSSSSAALPVPSSSSSSSSSALPVVSSSSSSSAVPVTPSSSSSSSSAVLPSSSSSSSAVVPPVSSSSSSSSSSIIALPSSSSSSSAVVPPVPSSSSSSSAVSVPSSSSSSSSSPALPVPSSSSSSSSALPSSSSSSSSVVLPPVPSSSSSSSSSALPPVASSSSSSSSVAVPLPSSSSSTGGIGSVSSSSVLAGVSSSSSSHGHGGVAGDPIIAGFHRQRFLVKGENERVFNLLTARHLQLNSRFLPLEDGQSLSAEKHKLLREARQREIANQKRNRTRGSSSSRPATLYPLPSTTPWSHCGTYLGELGILLPGGARIHGLPGSFLLGWQSLTVNGEELQVSRHPVWFNSSSEYVSVLHTTPHVLQVRTSVLIFELVNSDRFFNVDRAELLPGASASELDGLLGQTADPAVRPDNSAQWRKHVEYDYRVESDDVFSSDFARSKYSSEA